jgi:hypothetical protein
MSPRELGRHEMWNNRKVSFALKCSAMRRPPSSIACPTGKSVAGLSSPSRKNIPLRDLPKSTLELPPSRSTEGRLAIVTDAGRDAVDAAVSLTNDAKADGEVVWS